jgi:amino acid transporter
LSPRHRAGAPRRTVSGRFPGGRIGDPGEEGSAGQVDTWEELMTQARSREEAIERDRADLHKLGYAQELLRSMGGFSNFAISFSIISILTGAVILYDYGLAWAGTAAVLIGWPLVTVFVLAISASMGEIASAYPTAGGLYYWASRMKGKNWGWWTAWLNLIGQFAIVAGINYAAAGFINATIIDKIFGGTFNTVEFIPNVVNGQLVTMGVLMLFELALNIAGINLVALLNQVSVWWHIAIVAAVVVLIFLAGKPDESGLTLFAVQPLDTAGSWNNNLGVRELRVRTGDQLPGDPRVLLLAAPGELDVHRV